ncbi:type II toxin-antitoxin system PemK/MazF family toxin [Candidatus Woesearchaeota archaeon]|nr:type II toxin-antitoxin system PemK/MazF family toxin [Candidatus Woesearchaeota archaeon]
MKVHDIVLVNFPFSDLSESKLRPALIVAMPGGDNYVLCQITTKKRNIATYEINLPRNLCEGNIQFDSNIYVDMIFTLHNSLIQKSIGYVKALSAKEEVSKKILRLFS